MKSIFFALVTFSIVSITSCQKFEAEKPLVFDVSVDKTTFKVGEPVVFNFKGGDAHQISFYSGEVGNDYAYRNKSRVDQISRVFFSFQTNNTPNTTEINLVNPDLYISTDFNGEYDYDNVANNATWIPLSHLYEWSPRVVGAAPWTPSGIKDITDYIEDNKPFYLAFKVTSAAAPPTGALSRNWRTNNHLLMVETISENYLSLANFAGMGWQLVDRYLPTLEDIHTHTTSQVATSNILVLGYYRTDSPYFRQAAEVWGVSKRIQLGEINLGAEGSVSLKQYIDNPLESHTHYYEAPGVYKVVFVASNATISSSSQVIKELEITITP